MGNNRNHRLRRVDCEDCRGCTEQHRGNSHRILAADFHPRAFGTAGGKETEYLRRTNLS